MMEAADGRCVGRWGRGGAILSSDPSDLLALMLCKFLLTEMPASQTGNLWEDRNSRARGSTSHSLGRGLWPEAFFPFCQSFNSLYCLGRPKPSPEGDGALSKQ